MTFTVILKRDPEIEVEVVAKHVPGFRGSRIDPPEDPDIEVVSVTHEGTEIETTEAEDRKIYEYGIEVAVDEATDEGPDRE